MGILFIISAPSGGGKTSILKDVLARDTNLQLSISFTTRKARVGERPGVDYHFLSQSEFSDMIRGDALLEYAEVFGNYYGTSKSGVMAQLLHSDVVLEIDWQGALSIKKIYPDAVWVFILPPSISELSRRLLARQANDADDIELRLFQARIDMKYAEVSDYVIHNNEFSLACDDLHSIITSERLRSARQQQLIRGIIEN